MGRISSRKVATHHQAALQREFREYAQQCQERLTQQEEEQARQRSKPIEIFVQIMAGRRISLTIQKHDSVEEIRRKIQSKEGFSPDQQLLMKNGIKLLDGPTAEELYIRPGDILFLTLRNWGG